MNLTTTKAFYNTTEEYLCYAKEGDIIKANVRSNGIEARGIVAGLSASGYARFFLIGNLAGATISRNLLERSHASIQDLYKEVQKSYSITIDAEDNLDNIHVLGSLTQE
jgi:hypothetical protein